MAFAFEKLLVYQKSVDFADTVCGFTEQFPAATTILQTNSIERPYPYPRTLLKEMGVLPNPIESTFSELLVDLSRSACRN